MAKRLSGPKVTPQAGQARSPKPTGFPQLELGQASFMQLMRLAVFLRFTFLLGVFGLFLRPVHLLPF